MDRRDVTESDEGKATGLTVSIVVPVLNEEDMIGAFWTRLSPVLDEVRALLGPGSGTEIVFVDDGSTDRSVEVIRALDPGASDLRLVRLSRRFGKDSALSAGLRCAGGDAVIPMDVDLQDPPEILPEMVGLWREGAMIVNAVRADRSSDNWLKRRSAAAFYRVVNALSSFPIHADVGDYRLLDRKAVRVINDLPERVRFMKGLFSWAGFSPAQVSYAREERVSGSSKWRVWGLWNFALDGITGSSTLPLRIWSYLGGVTAILALLYALFLIVRTTIYGIDTPGYASLMVVVLFFGAVNFVALGIIGEYVGRIAIEVRQRPLYIVEEIETLSD